MEGKDLFRFIGAEVFLAVNMEQTTALRYCSISTLVVPLLHLRLHFALLELGFPFPVGLLPAHFISWFPDFGSKL